VGDDHHAVALAQLPEQFVDEGGGDGVEGRGRFVEEEDVGADGDGAGDAQALLLAAREAEARGVELVFHLGPEGGVAEGGFDSLVHLGAAQAGVHAQGEGDVFIDRHREGGRFLEHHAHPGAQPGDVAVMGEAAAGEDVFAVEQDFAVDPVARIKVADPVQRAQQGGFAAARGADQRGDQPVAEGDVDILQRMIVAVMEVELAGDDLRGEPGGVDGGGCGHLRPRAEIRRAVMESSSTPAAMSSAPAQARSCQSR